MATALEEKLLDRIENRLETLINATGGYNTDITDAYRALAGDAPLARAAADRPFIEIRHVGTTRRWHLRGAYECVMEIHLVLATDQNDETIRNLISDVHKLLDANVRWNDGSENLADRSWVAEGQIQEPEVGEGEATAVVPLLVKFYEDRTAPASVKAI